MKYDILTLQFFQEALEKVEKSRFDKQFGICDSIYQVCFMQHIKDFRYDYDIIKWMQKNYMPHREVGEFWWPTFLDEEKGNEQDLIQSKADRIAFLKRIIEDLMCGE